VSCDPQLGPVPWFGSGGVMVEVYNDVALRRSPLKRREAQAMIAEVKGARLLRSFRGRLAADLEALADTLVHLSHLAMNIEKHLAELDINPLTVLPVDHGVMTLSGRRFVCAAARSFGSHPCRAAAAGFRSLAQSRLAMIYNVTL
jgi:acyl-CoA synthetase (NDP forming)